MARCRIIHPEYWTSEKAGQVGMWAWTLFAALWTYADDEGRLRDDPQTISRQSFPHHSRYSSRSRVDHWLNLLQSVGSLSRYSVQGQNFIQICNWSKWQTINKPRQSRIPPPNSGSPTVAVREPSRSTNSRKGREREGKGNQSFKKGTSMPNVTSGAPIQPLEKPVSKSLSVGPQTSGNGLPPHTTDPTYLERHKELDKDTRRANADLYRRKYGVDLEALK